MIRGIGATVGGSQPVHQHPMQVLEHDFAANFQWNAPPTPHQQKHSPKTR